MSYTYIYDDDSKNPQKIFPFCFEACIIRILIPRNKSASRFIYLKALLLYWILLHLFVPVTAESKLGNGQVVIPVR